MNKKKLVFSGVQPTGNLHLGNYLGALKNFVSLQKDDNCIYCVVDLHAITTFQNPTELKNNILETTAGFLATGLDPNKSIIFNQSSVSCHAELAWIFNCVARIGWLNRMTQFKEKAGKDKEKASIGLYSYPILMAADILLYDATHVPVGDDQKQHLELCRDIAQKFNKVFVVRFFKIIVASVLMGLFFEFLISFFENQLNYSYQFKSLFLLVSVLLGLIFYLMISFFIKAFKSEDIKLK